MIICGRDDCVYKREGEGDSCHAPNIHLDKDGICHRYLRRTEAKDYPTYIDYSLKKQEEVEPETSKEPEPQPETMLGYELRGLSVAAHVLNEYGVTPEELKTLCNNLEFAGAITRAEHEKIMQQSIASMFGRSIVDDISPAHYIVELQEEEEKAYKEREGKQ